MCAVQRTSIFRFSFNCFKLQSNKVDLTDWQKPLSVYNICSVYINHRVILAGKIQDSSTVRTLVWHHVSSTAMRLTKSLYITFLSWSTAAKIISSISSWVNGSPTKCSQSLLTQIGIRGSFCNSIFTIRLQYHYETTEVGEKTDCLAILYGMQTFICHRSCKLFLRQVTFTIGIKYLKSL